MKIYAFDDDEDDREMFFRSKEKALQAHRDEYPVWGGPRTLTVYEINDRPNKDQIVAMLNGEGFAKNIVYIEP